ncbi:MAG: Mur ligase family protein, partial [Bacteroidota bacterium]
YFASKQVDIAVIETGLGGRLDSTNIIEPQLSIITSIGLDHMDFLGDTVEKIAREKAGIIKKDIPVILPQHLPEGTEQVFETQAKKVNASVRKESKLYQVTSLGQEVSCMKGPQMVFSNLVMGIQGHHFYKNIPTIVESVIALQELGYHISQENLERGLQKIVTNTGLKGRWQRLSTSPDIIADVGHNEDGWKAIIKQVHAGKYRKLHFVLGVVQGKRINAILDLLPFNALYYLCEPKIKRALPVEELADSVRKVGFSYTVCKDVNECISRAKAVAGPEDLIFVGGSTFVVAEIKDL